MTHLARPRTISDEQILETARSCFLEHGPGVSTDVIAEQLGVSSQALFKRFHNKQELILSSMVPCERSSWIDTAENGPDARPIEIQMLEMLSQIAVFFVDIARRMNVLRWAGIDSQELMSRFDEPPHLKDIRILSAWFKRAHDAGLVREVDYEATAMLVLTSLHGPEMLHDMTGQRPTIHTQSEYVEFLVELLLTGLQPRESIS